MTRAKTFAVRRTADDRTGPRAIRHCSTGWLRGGTFPFAMLCAACIVLFMTNANAGCTAQEVLRSHLTFKQAPLMVESPILLRSATTVPVWKTITVGTFANSFALLNALDAAGCAIGDSALEILARPAFIVSATKRSVELVAVSVAEFGFQTDVVRLADIYARARQLGFGLAAAEVAPQLRLQYFDQPVGEVLIAMDPIKTWEGKPVILTLANFGAGLTLLGRDGRADAEIPVASRFLFVRSNEAALAKAGGGLDGAAALVRH